MRLSDNTKGAAFMMGSMASFTINDAFMKAASDEMPLFQMLFLRGLGTLVLLLALARILGGYRTRLSARDWRLVALRSAAEVAAAFFFLTALFNMPIANATAIIQALPLTVTLAAALFLGEAVGWRRVTAILIGLVGVLLIVRPGTEGFTIYSVSALVAVAAVTLRDLATRRLSGTVPSIIVALSASLGVTLFFGLGSVAVDWRMPTPAGAAQLAGATVFVIGGYVFSILTMRTGEIGFIAPFRYTGLVWALVLGLVIFGEWPQPLTFLGAGIVVATGLYTLWRERQGGRIAPERALRIR